MATSITIDGRNGNQFRAGLDHEFGVWIEEQTPTGKIVNAVSERSNVARPIDRAKLLDTLMKQAKDEAEILKPSNNWFLQYFQTV